MDYKEEADKAREIREYFLYLGEYTCKRCEQEFPTEALDFHHREPKEKLFPLSSSNLYNRTPEALIVEFKKCDILCACCHRIVTKEQKNGSGVLQSKQ